jgi:hypothetical protein
MIVLVKDISLSSSLHLPKIAEIVICDVMSVLELCKNILVPSLPFHCACLYKKEIEERVVACFDVSHKTNQSEQSGQRFRWSPALSCVFRPWLETLPKSYVVGTGSYGGYRDLSHRCQLLVRLWIAQEASEETEKLGRRTVPSQVASSFYAQDSISSHVRCSVSTSSSHWH